MNIINSIVRHKIYGEGKIVKLGDSYLTILFDDGDNKF